MMPNSEPRIQISQRLIVPKYFATFSSMDTPRITFARRLNEVCDDMNVPPKHHARQIVVGKKFGVSPRGAAKWLEGESTPSYERCVEIAAWAGVNFEWLMTGRGPKRAGDVFASKAIEHVATMMQAMEPEQQYLTVRLVDSVAQPKNGTEHH